MAMRKEYMHPSLNERRQIVSDAESAGITLNGAPAVICGIALKFPVVTDVKTGMGCEFSWRAIAHNVKHNEGRFAS